MNNTSSNQGRIPRSHSEHGIALILTLSILVMVTLLVIAFAVSMRVEQTASANFNDLIRARQIAQSAVDQAVAKLRLATPPRTNITTTSTYVTAPGIIYQNNNGQLTTSQLVSAPASGADTNNLNSSYEITGQDTTYFNSPAASAITVNWMYVGQDGTVSAQPISSGSPVTGRFAYWVDDEACKININSAGAPTIPISTDSPYGADSAPGDVALSVLDTTLGSDAGNIVQQRTSAGAFPYAYTTPQEVLRADQNLVYGDYTTNQFYITTFSDDTGDLDVFGRPRRVLSGPAGLSVANDIANKTQTGAYGRLSDPSLETIYSSSAGTLGDKYANPVIPFAGASFDGLAQLIANIIAYQQTPGTPPPDGLGDPPPYLGLARVPYINEIKVSYTEAAGGVTRTVSVELNYLYGADKNYTAGANGAETIVVKNIPVIGTFLPSVTVPVTSGDVFSTSAQYHVYPFSDHITLAVPVTPPATPAKTPLIADYLQGGNRVDCAVVPLSTPAPQLTVAGSTFYGAEVNDPCLNEITTEWKEYIPPAKDSLGGPNSNLTPNLDPSKTHIRAGPMLSVGELGFIHTPYYAKNPAGPADWQYLRLQPQPMAEKNLNMIPDWAILDLFTVSNRVSGAQSPTQGRININSGVAILPPNGGAGRYSPLLALVDGAVNNSVTLDTIVNNIYSRMYANGDTFGNPNAYDTIGEICEVQGMTNAVSPATQASSEAIIRRIANLITVRSNAFTIWAVGQSIKKVDKTDPTHYRPDLGDFISGESKLQVVVERVVDSSNNVQFRTLYSRYIN